MRTDVTVKTKGYLKCCRATGSLNKHGMAERGDWVTSRNSSHNRLMHCRVVGFVVADGREWLCCVYMQTGGHLHECWIDPDDVVEIRDGKNCLYRDKAKWFYSDEFLDTPVDKARNVSELLYEDLISKETANESKVS